jgi:hypothetical protein
MEWQPSAIFAASLIRYLYLINLHSMNLDKEEIDWKDLSCNLEHTNSKHLQLILQGLLSCQHLSLL